MGAERYTFSSRFLIKTNTVSLWVAIAYFPWAE